MSEVKVAWKASERLLREEFVATGEKPKATRTLTIDLTELTPKQREPLIEMSEGWRLIDVSSRPRLDPKASYANYLGRDNISYDAEPSLAGILAHVTASVEQRALAEKYKVEVNRGKESRRARLLAGREERLSEIEALIEADDYEGLDELKGDESYTFRPRNEKSLKVMVSDARCKILKERRKAKKETWINRLGSDRLKRGYERGHDCQRLYAVERAHREAPGYTVDFDDTADWKERACPTAEALHEADEAEWLGLGAASIVWLTHLPKALWDDDEWFEASEAIVVRRFLGVYDLVKVL